MRILLALLLFATTAHAESVDEFMRNYNSYRTQQELRELRIEMEQERANRQLNEYMRQLDQVGKGSATLPPPLN